mmetsp:Transcript_33584/g.24233  ORF Transcript_33584/g.24233 Transcript_33584/m.24233 type:complete len:131 (-) Transcript_33584:1024-1416(-)|eukprot:CAMPEP_0116885012 /NCGR_PEP_ID=MMETSP0463-20121206/18147_1 /TAXON_ID=181622 /ORGANISM="Strombidinopsis sp, Strain SopsisLIS2011" /LENGTH=130 /DNA_ID=CAMNT_0004542577 /DNA_START=175 /DNA_END=567 /DNA_ORIENTATION=+
MKSQGGNKRIDAQALCDITGTKYYKHNEEIDYNDDKICKVFDENDGYIGDIRFADAYNEAKVIKKDIVLRNGNRDPPILKIMNYKLELLKRLFMKLGRNVNTDKEMKSKAIRLATSISVHDLENKKRQAQ